MMFNFLLPAEAFLHLAADDIWKPRDKRKKNSHIDNDLVVVYYFKKKHWVQVVAFSNNQISPQLNEWGKKGIITS